jgi:hypothetical protein
MPDRHEQLCPGWLCRAPCAQQGGGARSHLFGCESFNVICVTYFFGVVVARQLWLGSFFCRAPSWQQQQQPRRAVCSCSLSVLRLCTVGGVCGVPALTGWQQGQRL